MISLCNQYSCKQHRAICNLSIHATQSIEASSFWLIDWFDSFDSLTDPMLVLSRWTFPWANSNRGSRAWSKRSSLARTRSIGSRLRKRTRECDAWQIDRLARSKAGGVIIIVIPRWKNRRAGKAADHRALVCRMSESRAFKERQTTFTFFVLDIADE